MIKKTSPRVHEWRHRGIGLPGPPHLRQYCQPSSRRADAEWQAGRRVLDELVDGVDEVIKLLEGVAGGLGR